MTTRQPLEISAHEWLNLLLLRPYGQRNLTPKVKFWLACSLMVILLMSGLEGLVWGLISRHLVPESDQLLRVVIALFTSTFVFCLIWIADSSLILFAPTPNYQKIPSSAQSSAKAWMTEHSAFIFGILVRIVIVGISLFITAPMLSQVIRDDDISRALAADKINIRNEFLQLREHEFNAEIEQLEFQARNAQTAVEQDLKKNQEFNDTKATLEADRKQYHKEVENYLKEMKRQENGDSSVKAGRGSKFLAAKSRYDASVKALAETERQLFELKLPADGVSAQTADKFSQQISVARDKFNSLKANVQALNLTEFLDIYKEQLPRALPINTPGQRIQILKKLNETENIPHWQSTEGMAQALLIVLFLSLMALKGFEPSEVKLYLREDLQEVWQRYNDGVFDDLPGFVHSRIKRETYGNFAELYRQYQLNRENFLEIYLEQERTNLQQQQLDLEKQRAELAQQQEHERNSLEQERFKLGQERQLAELTLRQQVQQLAEEQELTKQHLAEQLTAEREHAEQLFQQEQLERRAAMDREEKRLHHELEMQRATLNVAQAQVEKEQELRKIRIEQELSQELKKLEMVAKGLEDERAIKISQAEQETKQLQYSLENEKHDAEVRRQQQALEFKEKRQLLEFELAHTKTEKLRALENEARTANIQQQQWELEFKEKRELLEFELARTKTEKLQAFENQQRENELRLQQLAQEFKEQAEKLQHEFELDKQRFQQEKLEKDAEIQLRLASVEAERKQAENEQALRKARMEQELNNELEKLKVAAKDLEEQRAFKQRQAEAERELLQRTQSIDAITTAIALIENDKEKQIQAMGQCQLKIDSCNLIIDRFDEHNVEAKQKLKQFETIIADKKNQRKDAETMKLEIRGRNDDTRHVDESIQKLNEEIVDAERQYKKLKNDFKEGFSKELQDAYNQINELKISLQSQQAKLQDIDGELGKWREKRRQLLLFDG